MNEWIHKKKQFLVKFLYKIFGMIVKSAVLCRTKYFYLNKVKGSFCCHSKQYFFFYICFAFYIQRVFTIEESEKTFMTFRFFQK